VRVAGVSRRALEEDGRGGGVVIIDQTLLPGRLALARLESLEDAVRAIATMQVRGAPLIGVTAAYGVALALRTDPSDASLARAAAALRASRPTAINLGWAVGRVERAVSGLARSARADAAWQEARAIAQGELAACEAIGRHGAGLLRARFAGGSGDRPLSVLTHCNAGWLATVDWGTALAPVYRLHDEGVPVHVWVSETRPRNQGLLTAWELGQHGVPYTLVVDNAAGLLFERGRVDLCLVGADRITRGGDVCNKIGTSLKALAARDAGIPFYVAAPASTIDWALDDPAAIPIEERAALEVTGDAGVPVFNPGFDVTPARHVTAIITERGVSGASAPELAALAGD
jgi:methylthioribose-1-phosphate isomerase